MSYPSRILTLWRAFTRPRTVPSISARVAEITSRPATLWASVLPRRFQRAFAKMSPRSAPRPTSYRDQRILLGQHPRGQQAGDAAAEHDRVVA